MAKQSKSTGKSEAKSSKSKPEASSSPLIDTNLAASAAARLLANRNRLNQAGQSSTGGNSAMFKQMKENLAKPHLEGMNSVLNQSAPPDHTRSDLPSGMRQNSQNQQSSSNAARTGVPRRTAG